MKVGDLVKFVGHHDGPIGIVLDFNDLPEPPPLQQDQRSAYIEWACKYTAAGSYQLRILEIIS